ncbi:MAG: HNH endonuclease [Deltaproteobacteria bacterium]|nr:HNH endonuclease [Deltaproteobacteria bacterium]
MTRGEALPVDVAERVLRLLDEGRYSATYKQAVLVALLDLCLESTERDGSPRDTLTTRQVAEKVVALYWPHTRIWGTEAGGRILVQSASGARAAVERGGGIVAKIRAFREALEQRSPATTTLALAHAAQPAYRRLLDDVEWTLIAMPLPKLQRIGDQNLEWLYRIAWRDAEEGGRAHADKPVPRRGQVAAYQRGAPSDFDNRIHLKPGVATAFARLHSLLRPYILRHWAAQVVRMNRLHDDDVSAFLFEQEREDTRAVRRPLVELQHGRCFYCESRLTADVHVDHFIPWARHPDNGLHNLVAADARCNSAKRDYLASLPHLERWRARSTHAREVLERIAADERWDTGEARMLGVARAIYLSLPDEMPLWVHGKAFEPSDAARLRLALSA